MPRSIYIVRSEAGPVKIGIAGNPQRRLTQLRTASPIRLHLDFAAETDGDVSAIERQVHEALRAKRLTGEWFDVDVAKARETVLGVAERLGLNLHVCTEDTVARNRRMSQGGFHSSIYFHKSVKNALDNIAHAERKNMRDLLDEAMDHVLTKRGHANIEALVATSAGKP